MRHLILALGALIASGWTACAAPLELYGKLPNIEQAAVSRSGKLIAYIATDGDQRTVVVQTTADHRTIVIAPAGAAKVRDVSWAGDDNIIVTVSSTASVVGLIGPKREYQTALDINLQTRRTWAFMEDTHGAHDAMNVVVGRPIVRQIDGKYVVFVHGIFFPGDQGQVGLFRVDLAQRTVNLVTSDNENTEDWLVDATGRPVAEELYRDRAGIWAMKMRATSGGWKTVERVASPIDPPDMIGLGGDRKTIVVDVGDDETGHAWREVSMETGVWTDPSTAITGARAIFAPDDGRIIGQWGLVGDDPRYAFNDPYDAAVWRGIVKAFPGDLVTLASWSDDRRKIVVRVDSATLGPAYALVDMDTHDASWLGNEYVGLKEEDIGQKTAVAYKAADGQEITGYLTLPHGREPKGLPLVVMPHGGPGARDEPGFDWWAQALASRGYAVLQPNFRGSTGLGLAFYKAGFGEWGRKMQTDLSDGVRDLARRGVIDPKRVCIVGASYGGYAALAGATMDHGVYRCAVSVAGVADLRQLVLDFQRKAGDESQRYWLRFIGSDRISDPVMTQYSPTAHAAEADAPILLIHGRDDTVVPIAQSRQMAQALKVAGKSVDLVEMPGEDHHLSRGATRLQMLQATVAFLEKYNPPK